jgi:hypothetical protein
VVGFTIDSRGKIPGKTCEKIVEVAVVAAAVVVTVVVVVAAVVVRPLYHLLARPAR